MGIVKKLFEIVYILIKFVIGVSFVLVIAFLWLFASPANVNATSEANVMTDLKSDPNFYEDDYADVSDNYSLVVIQVAETKEKELIVYVYQPSHKTIDLLGTKISISYGFSKNGKGLEPKVYALELLSTYDKFDKYLVKDFKVPNETRRYYNIVSIFRNSNSKIDELKDDYGDFTDIAISVGQQWYAYDINDTIAYEMGTFETMVIDTKIVEHFDFKNGLTWGSFVGQIEKGDCWFIAFNCEDYVIKHIYDADMSYIEQKVDILHSLIDKTEYGEKEPKTITLTDNDIMSYTGEGFGARTFEWNRILSSSDFITNVENNEVIFKDDVKKTIEQSQWVFTFAETVRVENKYGAQDYEYRETYYEISDVGVLRLHFLDTNGKTYDLGVVNSLFDPDNVPGGVGTTKILETIQDFFEKLFAILGLIVLVIVLMFISNLLTPFIMVLKTIGQVVIYILSIPFKILKWVFKRK